MKSYTKTWWHLFLVKWCREPMQRCPLKLPGMKRSPSRPQCFARVWTTSCRLKPNKRTNFHEREFSCPSSSEFICLFSWKSCKRVLATAFVRMLLSVHSARWWHVLISIQAPDHGGTRLKKKCQEKYSKCSPVDKRKHTLTCWWILTCLMCHRKELQHHDKNWFNFQHRTENMLVSDDFCHVQTPCAAYRAHETTYVSSATCTYCVSPCLILTLAW